jgi:hypothetical protein
MASEEFQLLDCEFCDDVIDVSDQDLPAPLIRLPPCTHNGSWRTS